MRLKAALLFMLLGTTSCLQFLDECMPEKKVEAYVKGSEMKLRVWVPEIGDARLLTLISENHLTGISRKIEIRKNVTTVQTKDEEKVSPEQELPIQNNSLPHGWVTFMVASDENFTVTVPEANLTFIDIRDEVQGKYIKIRGSNVTVNCRLPANNWEVSAGQKAFIPLSLEGPHDFSLFSRAPFVPELAVGLGSLEPLGIASLSSVFGLESEQMAAISFYNFTLDCTIAVRKSSCYIRAGDYTVLVGSLPRGSPSLSLIAGGTDDYIIVQRIREDQNGGGPSARMTPTGYLVAFGTCIAWFIVGIVLTWVVMKKQTKREKSHIVMDQGGNEKVSSSSDSGESSSSDSGITGKNAAYHDKIQKSSKKKKQTKREKNHTAMDQGGNEKKEGNESTDHTTIPLMQESLSSLDSGVITTGSCSLSSSETSMVITTGSCSLSSSETSMKSTKLNEVARAAQTTEERRNHLDPVSEEACLV